MFYVDTRVCVCAFLQKGKFNTAFDASGMKWFPDGSIWKWNDSVGLSGITIWFDIVRIKGGYDVMPCLLPFYIHLNEFVSTVNVTDIALH